MCTYIQNLHIVREWGGRANGRREGGEGGVRGGEGGGEREREGGKVGFVRAREPWLERALYSTGRPAGRRHSPTSVGRPAGRRPAAQFFFVSCRPW